MTQDRLVATAVIVWFFFVMAMCGCAGEMSAAPKPQYVIKQNPLVCHDKKNPRVIIDCQSVGSDEAFKAKSEPAPAEEKSGDSPQSGTVPSSGATPESSPAAEAIKAEAPKAAPASPSPSTSSGNNDAATKGDVAKVETRVAKTERNLGRVVQVLKNQRDREATGLASPTASTIPGRRHRPVPGCGGNGLAIKNMTGTGYTILVDDAMAVQPGGRPLVVQPGQPDGGFTTPAYGHVCLPSGQVLGDHTLVVVHYSFDASRNSWEKVMVWHAASKQAIAKTSTFPFTIRDTSSPHTFRIADWVGGSALE